MSDGNAESVLSGNSSDGVGAPVSGVAEQTQADWTSGFDDNIRGIVQTKGWKSPNDVINSYSNLEKLMGSDKAGRGVILPKDDAPPEEWGKFYQKLGRPENPDGYKLNVPDGASQEFANTAAKKFHELGITAKQGEQLAQWWNEHMGSAQHTYDEQFAQKSVIEIQDLKKEWGVKFDENAEIAKRAIRESGMSDDEAIAIERAIGIKKAAQVFSFLGKQFAESQAKGMDSGKSSFAATPSDAKAKIAALRNDQQWTSKYLNGDVDARAEFERLHRIAYPDT
jgi:hypothetical protein